MTTWGRGPRGKATMLHSYLVRSRGACQRCGKPGEDQTVRIPGMGTYVLPIGGLDCAHIVGRRFVATRTDERNAWALCRGCHRRLGEHADEHMHFVAQTIGMAQFDRIKTRALSGQQGKASFWLAEVDRLTALLAEVSS